MFFHINAEDGYLTVEAAVIVPFLIFVFTSFVYLTIYVFDRAMFCQDMYVLAVFAKDSGLTDEEELTEELSRHFNEIKKEHPYLCVNSMNMSYSIKYERLTVSGKLVMNNPIADMVEGFLMGNSFVIETQKDILLTNPVDIMYITRDIQEEQE